VAETKSSRSPKWLYRFLDWLKATPFQGILVIAALLILGALINHWPYWQSGLLNRYEFDPEILFSATWFPLNLLVWLLMDRIALTALRDFGKGIGKSEKEVTGIYNNFVSVPWATFLVVLAIVVGLGNAAQVARSAGLTDPLLIGVSGLWSTLGGIFEGMALVRIIRQLFLVNQLYREVKKINLFNLWPVYALSRYGYTLAFYIILSTALIYVVIDLVSGSGFAVGQVLYSAVFALIIFWGPLLGINSRLRKEKENQLQKIGSELSSVYAETETAIHKRNLGKVSALRNAAAALKEQMESVQKVATWPWNPGSVRNLLLPVLLPLFIAILQRYVLSFLGF
jgi:hypothetical protein